MSIGINSNSSIYGSSVYQTQQAQQAEESTEPTQSLDDFKQEIYDEIRKMKVHSSQSGTQISISISDKAFEKMMSDPDYKNKMLQTIARDLSGAYPGGGAAPSYSVIKIGDDLSYRADAYGSSYSGVFGRAASDNFMTINAQDTASDERRKAQEAAYYQDALLRSIMENKWQGRAAYDKEQKMDIQALQFSLASQRQNAMAQNQNADYTKNMFIPQYAIPNALRFF